MVAPLAPQGQYFDFHTYLYDIAWVKPLLTPKSFHDTVTVMKNKRMKAGTVHSCNGKTTTHACDERKCFKTFSDGHGFRGGQCCCNCNSQHSLHSHPWVDGKPMSHRIGWACVSAGVSRQKAVISNRHGLCEMHEPRTKAKTK